MKPVLFVFTVTLLLSSVFLDVAHAKKAGGFQEIVPEEEATENSREKAGPSDEVEAASTETTEKKPALKENEEILSGTVRVVRRLDRTEVFFKDLKQSYVIPSNILYNSIYRAFEESQKKGTAVSFKANSKTRQILSIESSAPSAASGGNTASGTSAQGTSGKKGSQ